MQRQTERSFQGCPLANHPIDFKKVLTPEPCYLTKGHKKRAPLSPTFVNLKSNTMKNTVQRFYFAKRVEG